MQHFVGIAISRCFGGFAKKIALARVPAVTNPSKSAIRKVLNATRNATKGSQTRVINCLSHCLWLVIPTGPPLECLSPASLHSLSLKINTLPFAVVAAPSLSDEALENVPRKARLLPSWAMMAGALFDNLRSWKLNHIYPPRRRPRHQP